MEHINKNNESWLNCHVCGCNTSKFLSVNSTNEYLDKRAYSHISSQSLIDICLSCSQEQYSPQSLSLHTQSIISKHIDQKESDLILHGENYHYRCSCCMDEIEDGSPINVIDINLQVFERNILDTIEANMISIVCDDCEASLNLTDQVSIALKEIINSKNDITYSI